MTLSVGEIVGLVADSFKLEPHDIMHATRGTKVQALARQVAMYLAHCELGMDYTTVGRHFSRDRTCVAYACAEIEDCRDDAEFDQHIDDIEQAYREWLATGGLAVAS